MQRPTSLVCVLRVASSSRSSVRCVTQKSLKSATTSLGSGTCGSRVAGTVASGYDRPHRVVVPGEGMTRTPE